MSRAFTPRRLLLAVLLVALAALALLGQNFRVFDRAWFAVQEWRHADAWKERSIWLPDYRVRVEAQPIEGLSDDVSALTFDPDRRTLFTVTNQPAQIIELSLQGKVLRTIPLTGFGDAEAIEYISRGVYVITDEREQRLVKVRLEDDTRFIDAADAQQLSLGIGLNGNKGFEGLAYDPLRQRLFVAREKAPVGIIEVNGFFNDRGEALDLSVGGDPRRDRGLFLTDLSSLYYHKASDHLLVLSDESRLVIELDRAGRPLGGLTLRAGNHGLADDVPQAEGLAMDDRGNLYLVSEPNLFYRFSRPLRAGR